LLPKQDLIQNAPKDAGMDMVAAVASDGSFLLAYTPYGSDFTLDLQDLKGRRINIRWFDPSIGEFIEAGTVEKTATMDFDPPSDEKRGNDWVLVLRGE